MDKFTLRGIIVEFTLRGIIVEVRYIPGSHYVLEWLGNEVNIIGEQSPSVREMTIAVEAYRQGWAQGQVIGRTNLQNDIKALLDR